MNTVVNQRGESKKTASSEQGNLRGLEENREKGSESNSFKRGSIKEDMWMWTEGILKHIERIHMG